MENNRRQAIELSFYFLDFLIPSLRQSGPVSGTNNFGSDNPTGTEGLWLLIGKVGGLGNYKKTFEKGDQ